MPRIATSGQFTMGVKLVPPMKDMKVLDPSGKQDSVYNRYAWITVNSKQIADLLDSKWGDTTVFRKTNQDGYIIYIDPCSPKFKQLGVKYFVFDYAPKPQEVRCMTKLKENVGIEDCQLAHDIGEGFKDGVLPSEYTVLSSSVMGVVEAAGVAGLGAAAGLGAGVAAGALGAGACASSRAGRNIKITRIHSG